MCLNCSKKFNIECQLQIIKKKYDCPYCTETYEETDI